MSEVPIHNPVHDLWTMSTSHERATGGVPLIISEYRALWVAQNLRLDEPRLTFEQSLAIVAAWFYVAPRVEVIRPGSGPPGLRGLHPSALILDEMNGLVEEGDRSTSHLAQLVSEVDRPRREWSPPSRAFLSNTWSGRRHRSNAPLAIHPATLAECERLTR